MSPCDPETTLWLLRCAVDRPAEDVDLDLVIELVAQLATDLRGWNWDRFDTGR